MEAALFVVALVALQGQGEATEKAAQAYLKQTKIDEVLDRYQRHLLTDEQRTFIGNTALVARIAIEKQVTFKWSF